MNKKRINGRQKGARGERWVANWLTAHGFKAERAARIGVKGGEDIKCDCLDGRLHIEVKFREDVKLGTKALKDALSQSYEAAPDVEPCVIWKNNRGPLCLSYYDDGWVATVAGDEAVAGWLTKYKEVK